MDRKSWGLGLVPGSKKERDAFMRSHSEGRRKARVVSVRPHTRRGGILVNGSNRSTGRD